jgi:archaellum component FlaC
MKLFNWAKPKSDVVMNAEISQMTMPQLRERIAKQRGVIQSQREEINRLNSDLRQLKKSGESIIQDILLIRSACLDNYDELPEQVKTLIDKS